MKKVFIFITLLFACLSITGCKKIKFDGIPYSCKAYPKKNGIPPEIWNGKVKKCNHYEPKT